MLTRIGKFLLLVQFGMAAILCNSSFTRLKSLGEKDYSFNHPDPFKNTSIANEVIDSSHKIIHNQAPEPEKKPVISEKIPEALTPEKIEIEEVDSSDYPVEPPIIEKEHKILITKSVKDTI